MKSIMVKVVVGIVLPVLLFAWGNDLVVDTMRRSDNEFPVSYDIIWPNDTNMIIAVGYNYENTSSYVNLYQSTDQGQTITNFVSMYDENNKIKSIQLGYFEPYGILLWLTADGRLWMITFDLQTLTYAGASQIAPNDSVIAAFFTKIVKNDTLTLYVATTSRNSSYDAMKIYRSINYSLPFEKVDSVGYLNSSAYYTYRDIDAIIHSDSIKVYATFEYLDRSTNDKNHYFWIFKDQPDRLFIYNGTRNLETEPSANSNYPSLGVAPGGYLVCLYEVNGDIKYAFSNDYGNTVVIYDFPFDTPDSAESTPVVISWAIPPYFRGFNTLFTRGNNLYFVDANCSSGGMSWGTPVLVSDEHPYSTYIFREVQSYLPRLANRYGLSTPAALWARDFQHYMYPIFYYDSTYICVDNMSATGINEDGYFNERLLFSVNTISRGKVVINLASKIEETAKGMILTADGRVVKTFEIKKDEKNYTIETSEIPAGIYFINLKNSKTSGLKKFIITK